MSLVQYEVVGKDRNIGLIRLNRPKALNALSQALLKAIADKITEVEGDEQINVIIITGNGPAFSAGADLKEAVGIQMEDIFGEEQTSVRTIYSAKKPVIAAVNGVAYGGGCELAMMCDIVLASEKARFGQPEVLVGTVPGWGGTQRLTRAIGKSLAMQLLLSGQSIDANEAKQALLVSKVFPHDRLMEETIKLAEVIAAQSPKVVKIIKESTNKAYELSLEEGLHLERRMNQAGMGLKDRVEGMMAFVEKRRPKWIKAKI